MTRQIVVLHGALGSADQMVPVADALRELGEPLLIELPGHGSTPLGEHAFTMAGFRDALAARVAQGSIAAGATLFGYSMGGYVGLALESMQPGTFGRIVTLGTKFDWTSESANAAAVRLDPDTISAKVPTFVAALESRHAGGDGWRLVLTRTAAMLRALGDAPLLSRESLARIAIPVTVAVGTKDDTLTDAESRAAAEAMQHGLFTQLDGVPHPIERVPVGEVVRLVREALAR